MHKIILKSYYKGMKAIVQIFLHSFMLFYLLWNEDRLYKKDKIFLFTIYYNGINRIVVTLCTFVYLFIHLQFIVDFKMS